MSKRIIPIVLVLSIVLSVLLIPTAFASSEAQIIVSNVTADPGATVDVNITFANNPGIMGATLNVTYDDSALTLVSVNDGGILGTQSHKPELKSPYTLAWSDDTATVNNTANGVAATLTFKVSSRAVKGKSYPIAVSYDYDNYGIYDVNLNRVIFTPVNGSVKVSGNSEQPTVPGPDEAQIIVSNVTADPGATVDVNITFANNPGIMGATLNVTYDDSALTLVSVKDGGILGTQSHKPELKSPYTLAWSDDTAVTNNTSNGVAATLTFKVSGSAVKGKSYPIAVSYDYDNYGIYDVNLNRVMFTPVNGSVKVSSDVPSNYILGDVDSNGEVMVTDATFIQRMIAQIDIPFVLVEKVADVDGDGDVTLMDVSYIQRWLANLHVSYNIGKPIA